MVFERIREWLRRPESRLLLLTAEAGFGKALSAHDSASTLRSDAVTVCTKWQHMNDSQQRDVVIYQLLPYEPGLTLREREKILGEELGYRKEGPQRKARESASPVSRPNTLTEGYHEISGDGRQRRSFGRRGGRDETPMPAGRSVYRIFMHYIPI